MRKLFTFFTFLVFGAMLLTGCNITIPKGASNVPPQGKAPVTGTPSTYGETATETPATDTVAEVPAATTTAVCQIDGDCVPKPECHPHECMLKSEADKLEKPQVCTMMYDYQAAYSAEDCACKEGACVNKNLGRTSGI